MICNKRIKIIIEAFVILLLFVPYSNCQVNNKDMFNADLKLWLDWKIKQNLLPYQREAINFMENAGRYYSLTINLVDNSKNQLAIAEKITSINSYVNGLKKIRYPKQCKEYRKILLMYLNLMKENLALKQRGFSDGLERNRKIVSKILKLEGEIYIESFRVLKNINLFDNFDKELAGLKSLQDPQDPDAFQPNR